MFKLGVQIKFFSKRNKRPAISCFSRAKTTLAGYLLVNSAAAPTLPIRKKCHLKENSRSRKPKDFLLYNTGRRVSHRKTTICAFHESA
jgi:hypothetical protein